MSWDLQKAYLEGLAEDEEVPFSYKEPEPGSGEVTPGLAGPQVRENVDAGVHVIDLAEMRRQLESDRGKRGG